MDIPLFHSAVARWARDAQIARGELRKWSNPTTLDALLQRVQPAHATVEGVYRDAHAAGPSFGPAPRDGVVQLAPIEGRSYVAGRRYRVEGMYRPDDRRLEPFAVEALGDGGVHAHCGVRVEVLRAANDPARARDDMPAFAVCDVLYGTRGNVTCLAILSFHTSIDVIGLLQERCRIAWRGAFPLRAMPSVFSLHDDLYPGWPLWPARDLPASPAELVPVLRERFARAIDTDQTRGSHIEATIVAARRDELHVLRFGLTRALLRRDGATAVQIWEDSFERRLRAEGKAAPEGFDNVLCSALDPVPIPDFEPAPFTSPIQRGDRWVFVAASSPNSLAVSIDELAAPPLAEAARAYERAAAPWPGALHSWALASIELVDDE